MRPYFRNAFVMVLVFVVLSATTLIRAQKRTIRPSSLPLHPQVLETTRVSAVSLSRTAIQVH